MPTPHLLLYTDDPGIGGTAHYNHTLLTALAALNFKLSTICSPADNPLLAQQKSLNIQQLFLSFDSLKDFPAALQNDAEAHALLTRSRPDLILFSNNCPLSNFAAKRVARQLQIPYLVVEAFVAPYLAQNFAQLLPELEHHYRSARAVIAVSHENLSLLRQFFRLAPTAGQVIHYGRPDIFFQSPNPQTRSRIRASLCIPDDALVSLTTARLEPVKGYQYQLEAIKQLQSTPLWPNLHFLWVGPGSGEADLRSALKNLHADSHVHLLGQRWDIPDLLDTADLFLLPSELEGMPLSIMEAMAKSLPVLASAVSGIPEQLASTGKLLPDPKINPVATISQIVSTLTTWAADPALRKSLGTQAHARAKDLFHESRMIQKTLTAIDHTLLPPRDYVSPEFKVIRPDHAFPNMVLGNVANHPFPYLRREIPHNWYCDRRHPVIGFASRDEAAILHNTALLFQGQPALEIGCWMGWSACHLALAGVHLDVIDPLLANPEVRASVEQSLTAANALQNVSLHPGSSPDLVHQLAAANPHKKWSLIFIDGDHARPGPLNDAIAVIPHAADDAAILFHDLASPEVADALHYLRDHGWKTLLYQTMQIMAIAYRGNVTPPHHIPDPAIHWPLPPFLAGYPISGMPNPQPPRGLNILNKSQIPQSPTRRQLANLLLQSHPNDLPALLHSHVIPALTQLRKDNTLLLPLSPQDATFIDSLSPQLQSNTPAALLAASLFRQAYQLPLPINLDSLPDHLLEFHLNFLLYSPPLFTQLGDADRYLAFLTGWLNYLHPNILQNPNTPRWKAIREIVASRANFVPVYFTTANLRTLYSQRGDIIDAALRGADFPLDHSFPPRNPSPKIRLGILAQHFAPVPETFAALALYEHLGQDFETILYTVQLTNHRLEHYCRSRASTLKHLPPSPRAQADLIRSDNLDILFLATNVTAVLNPIAILAAHRLARHQTTSISSVTTTGLPTIDSYLSSPLTDPSPNAPSHYREQLRLLADPSTPIHCFSYGSEKNVATYFPTRPQLNIPDNALLFASGANVYKILPELQHTWAKILANVPNSLLLLYPYGPNWSSNYAKQIFVTNFSAVLHSHNVDPARLRILDPAPTPNRDDIKEFLKLADLYLDSFPFAGSTSLIDPLEVFLPTIVRTSLEPPLRSSMSAALLKSLRLEELITSTEQSYITLATTLAKNPAQRELLRQKIQSAMSQNPPFLDSHSYAQKITPLLQSLLPDMTDH